MKKTFKLIALLTALVISVFLIGCSNNTPSASTQPSEAASPEAQDPTDAPTDTPSDDPTEIPSDDPAEIPSDDPTDTPSDDPIDTPSDDPIDTPSDDPIDTPSDDPTDTPSDDPIDTPSDRIEVSAGSSILDFAEGRNTWSMFDLSYYDFKIPPTSLITGSEAQSGSALKITIGGDPLHGTSLLLLDPTDGGNSQGFAPIADYDYFRFWVSNQGDSDVSIAVVLADINANKSTTLGPDGAFINDQEGNPEDCFPTDLAGVNATVGTGETHINIPAGFTGWAYYSLAEADQVPWWEGTTLTTDEIASIVNMIKIDIRYDDATCADYLILDNFCLANEE